MPKHYKQRHGTRKIDTKNYIDYLREAAQNQGGEYQRQWEVIKSRAETRRKTRHKIVESDFDLTFRR